VIDDEPAEQHPTTGRLAGDGNLLGGDGLPAADAPDGTPDAEPAPRRRRRLGPLGETVVIVVVALLLSFLVKTFLVQPFSIPSESMEGTLVKGDRVLVSKTVPQVFDVHRGDVVVFKDSQDWLDGQPETPAPTGVRKVLSTVLTGVGILPAGSDEYLVKRVIGVGGDEVTCCDTEGRVSVNGVSLDETYLKPGSIPSEKEFDVVVPADHLWVMGDNRQHSGDSRYHVDQPGGGFVPLSDVAGTAFVKIWPASRWATMRNPGDVFADVPDPS